MLAANSSPAQVVTNAFDVASSYTGTGFTGNQGYGFGAWTLNTPGGGDYISGDNPANFGIWNNTANSATTAERSFNSALTVGETFAVQLMLNNLDSSSTINALELQNSSGTVLFSYWHQGGDSNNGWYSDAAVTAGTATGFSYDYQQLDSFAFTLTSPTTYTFADLSTGASLTGTLAGAVDEVTFLRSNESSSSPSNGQDFKFNTLEITSVPEPASVSFAALGFSLMLAFRRRLA
jgi:hypothetical protein